MSVFNAIKTASIVMDLFTLIVYNVILELIYINKNTVLLKICMECSKTM